MPHNLSSPSGDTLLARAVGDLPSDLTVHIGDNGTPSRRHTRLGPSSRRRTTWSTCSSGTPCSAPPQRRCTPPMTPPPAAHASPDDRLALVKARASLLLTLVGACGRLHSCHAHLQ
jgi:hypothetical protein